MNGIDKTDTPAGYTLFLSDVKQKILAAQIRASLALNREVISLYWDIGGMIVERQENEGWGAQVIDRLARDIKNELPEVKGFSSRNMRRMRLFYHEYPALGDVENRIQLQENKGGKIWPQAAAELAAKTLDLP